MPDRAADDGLTGHQRGEKPGEPRIRVLVAEDNPVNIEVARAYLDGLDCAVEIVECGADALSAFARQPFDLVLMDCQMPDMDGLEATRRIRQAEKRSNADRTPVVAVTANAYEEDRKACLAAGMDDYLTAILRKWTPWQAAQPEAQPESRPTDLIVSERALRKSA